MLLRRRARKQFDVRVDHDVDQFLKSTLGSQSRILFALDVAKQEIDFGRALIAFVVFTSFNRDYIFESRLDEFADRMSRSSRHKSSPSSSYRRRMGDIPA
jgi:hypothetical protein